MRDIDGQGELGRYATVHANTGALAELFSCGKAGSPVIARLSGGDLLLTKDAIGITIGPDGKPSRKVRPLAQEPCYSHDDNIVLTDQCRALWRLLWPVGHAENSSHESMPAPGDQTLPGIG